MAQRLLFQAHKSKDAQRIFSDKIEHKKLFLRPGSPTLDDARINRRKARESRERSERKKKLKPKPLSAKERRRMRLYEVSKKSKYSIYEPVHEMWLGYIREVLGPDLYHGGLTAAGKLTSAEYFGAKATVSRSNCPSRVGIHGIIIKDTKFTFEIITPTNAVKVIPKEGTLFRVEIPPPEEHSSTSDDAHGNDASPFVCEIYGEQFQHRPADRSNKKFKHHFLKNI